MDQSILIDNANSPELNGKYLGTITQDFVAISELLREASSAIRNRGISDYPVFPICKAEQPIGALLINKYEERDEIINSERQWHFYMSFLSEFEQRGLVGTENIDAFISAYKNPDEFCCLFVIDPDFTNFVFIPYPED